MNDSNFVKTLDEDNINEIKNRLCDEIIIEISKLQNIGD